MAEIMETFETKQPWVVYTYGLTHDLWWPLWNSTRVLGYMKIVCRCAICGDRTVLKLRIPRFGRVVDNGPHPARTAYLKQHQHPMQKTAPETWSLPLLNPEAHGDVLDILRDVAAGVGAKLRRRRDTQKASER